MSGICAFYSRDEQLDARANVQKLLGGKGKASDIISEGPIGLGFYNSFEDELKGMVYSDDSCIVVCTAELYQTPHGPGFQREAELIAQLYKEKAGRWMDEVHGVWSVALFDKRAKTLHCWADRVGAQFLHWAESSDGFAVCTTITPLSRLPGVNTERNNQAIYLYIEMEMIPTPLTIYRGVNKLEAGHVITVVDNRNTISPYWDMQYPVDAGSNEKDLIEQIRSITKTQLKNQLDYGVGVTSVGSFLSGGTDSSLITGLTHEFYPGDVNTFSMGFDESGYDEMEFSAIASKAFSTRHHEHYVSEKDILETLPLIVESFDEPYANSSVVPALICARMANDAGLKTLLGGDGGDEVFGGNTRYHRYFAHFQRFPDWVPALLKPILGSLPANVKRGFIKKADNYVNRASAPLPELVHAFGLHYLFDDKQIFHTEFLEDGDFQSPSDVSRRYIERPSTNDRLHLYLYHDLKITLMDNDLRKVGRMTELAEMRVRYPYLDYQLIEFSGRFASDLKVRNGELRYLFKKAFADILPREIIEKKKHGFGLPIVPWMLRNGPLNELLQDTLFDGRLARRHIFEENFVRALYRKAQDNPARSYGRFLYYIFFMELWFRKHMDST